MTETTMADAVSDLINDWTDARCRRAGLLAAIKVAQS